jgi:hypothetical protein
MVARIFFAALVAAAFTTAGRAQTPQPFPRAGTPQQQRPAPAPATPATPPQRPAVPDSSNTAPSAKPDANAPTAEVLGVAVYPGAQFLSSYDAGRGQRYYLFGTTASFAEMLGYYRTQTGERGDLVFKDPPTHMFTGGTLTRYREETMAFPPSVTIKDWTSGGTAGYPNPRPGAQPQRFPTVIMIVPGPAGAPAPR